jgi:hypothetical protein
MATSGIKTIEMRTCYTENRKQYMSIRKQTFVLLSIGSSFTQDLDLRIKKSLSKG